METDIRIIAHRCGGVLAPENSASGLYAAARAGFRAVEFDVMLSADGTPWLIHDETLDRTTDGSGRVADSSDAVLARLSCSRGWLDTRVHEPLVKLQDALSVLAELGLWANIEIKPATGFECETGEVVARTVVDFLARSQKTFNAGMGMPLLSSFSSIALEASAKAAPHLSRALLVEEVPTDWQSKMAASGAVAMHCAYDSGGAISDVIAAGVPVRCYTVNDPVIAVQLFERGVVAVFSDALPLFVEAGLR